MARLRPCMQKKKQKKCESVSINMLRHSKINAASIDSTELRRQTGTLRRTLFQTWTETSKIQKVNKNA